MLPPVCRVDARERGTQKPAPLDRGRANWPWYHPGSPLSRDGGLASRGRFGSTPTRRKPEVTVARPAMPTERSAVEVARNQPRWDAAAPAHAGAVGIAARRSCSNGLPAPPSHHSRLAEPAVGRLLVLVIAMGPCAGEEEQKTTTDVVVDVHIAHLAGCSPAGIGTRRITAGCRASKGRFPPPLWMSAGLHSLVDGDDSKRWPRLSSGQSRIASVVSRPPRCNTGLSHSLNTPE